METREAFGKVLREIRTAKGISQENLADICGLDRTFISLLERGKQNPSLNSILLLAKGLGVPPDEMVKAVVKFKPKVPWPK